MLGAKSGEDSAMTIAMDMLVATRGAKAVIAINDFVILNLKLHLFFANSITK
jgi:hypothetical protein